MDAFTNAVWPVAGTARDVTNYISCLSWEFCLILRMWSGAYNRQRTRAIQKGTTKGDTLNSTYPSLLLWGYYVQLYAELISSICEYDISQHTKQVQFHCYPSWNRYHHHHIPPQKLKKRYPNDRSLSDDADVFAKLVFWTSKKGITANIKKDYKWNHGFLSIELWPGKCRHVLGIHALSGCNTVLFPYGN